VEFYLTRGMCRASMGNFTAAIDDHSRAIDLEPSAATLSQRGWLYALRGNPVFGLQDFEAALARSPDHADAHCGRGLTLALIGRHADAAAAAERALDLAEPSFAGTYKAATVFAAAAPRVVLSDEEKKKQGPTPGQLRVKYIERAAELVDRALAHESADLHDDLWAAHVETDVHFQPLLVEPEFKKLKRAVLERSADPPRAAADSGPSTIVGTATTGSAL
jgi:tetratricopeptide (TPR) repeat protein